MMTMTTKADGRLEGSLRLFEGVHRNVMICQLETPRRHR